MKGLLIYLILTFFLCNLSVLAQIDEAEQRVLDSIAAKKNQKELQQEQRNLNFQRFFFEALQQRAIGNYDKALEALDKCQKIRKDDLAIIFELSKNYFAQEKFFEAIIYAERALEQKPLDVYLLEHLKDIYVRQKDYKKALDVQLQIVDQRPQNQADLIILYIRNNQIENARQLLVELEKNGMLSESLAPFKDSLFPNRNTKNPNGIETGQSTNQSLDDLKITYQKAKSFQLLKEILEHQMKVNEILDLEEYSREGLGLFPAQPIVYLMHGRALNKLKKYAEAIPILKSGLDYVIDDSIMESDFYEELSLSYKGIRQNVESNKYYRMALEKRQKKL